MDWSALLSAVPAWSAYLVVGLIVMLESLGIPLPGETVLIAAALISRHPDSQFHVLGIGIAASLAAIVGDSIGYSIGHRYGRRFLAWSRRKFPKHVDAVQIGYAEHLIERYGMWAVFGGRFVALLRIFAGPLAGTLRMPYRHFLPANAAGGICWAGGVTALIWLLGSLAEGWVTKIGWLLLAGLIAAVVLAGRWMGREWARRAQAWAAQAGVSMDDPIR